MIRAGVTITCPRCDQPATLVQSGDRLDGSRFERFICAVCVRVFDRFRHPASTQILDEIGG